MSKINSLDSLYYKIIITIFSIFLFFVTLIFSSDPSKTGFLNFDEMLGYVFRPYLGIFVILYLIISFVVIPLINFYYLHLKKTQIPQLIKQFCYFLYPNPYQN